MPSATTQMDREGIMLSEISRIETNTIQSHLYVEFFKIHTYIYIYIDIHTHIHRERDSENKLVIAKGEE